MQKKSKFYNLNAIYRLRTAKINVKIARRAFPSMQFEYRLSTNIKKLFFRAPSEHKRASSIEQLDAPSNTIKNC